MQWDHIRRRSSKLKAVMKEKKKRKEEMNKTTKKMNGRKKVRSVWKICKHQDRYRGTIAVDEETEGLIRAI